MCRPHIEHASSMAQSHTAASQVGHYAGISAAGAIQHGAEAICSLLEVDAGTACCVCMRVGVGVLPLSVFRCILKLAHSALAACRPLHTPTAGAARACWMSFDAPRSPLQECHYEARRERRYAEISAKNRTRPDVGATAFGSRSHPGGRCGRQRGWRVCPSVDGGHGQPSLCGLAGSGRQLGGHLCMAGGCHDECQPHTPQHDCYLGSKADLDHFLLV